MLNIIKQSNEGTFKVYNQYKRAIIKEGNVKVQNLVKKYFQVCDFEFRGLRLIKDAGLEIKEEFSAYDASKKFDYTVQSKNQSKAFIFGQILRGLAKLYDCKVFSRSCTPRNPKKVIWFQVRMLVRRTINIQM